MLELTIPGREFFNEATSEFISVKPTVLQLEHSLISLSKWESKWKKPFISKTPKTYEESVDYIRCMTIGKVDPLVYLAIDTKMLEQVNAYIDDPMTATTFGPEKQTGQQSKKTTAEILYYQMTALNIPFECEKWHLNRLLTLIHVCAIKSQPPKKMSKKEAAKRNASINAANKKRFGSRG